VALDQLPDPPQLLKELFEGTHRLSKNFFENIRRLNSALSFASFNPMPTNLAGRGPKAIKVKLYSLLIY
jgi:hypothetical protein